MLLQVKKQADTDFYKLYKLSLAATCKQDVQRTNR